MVDLRATNIKLVQRAKGILRFIGGSACNQSDEELDQILKQCRGSVKLAAVTIVLDVPVSEAEERLERHKGVLARVFEEKRVYTTREEAQSDELVLCVDAGGSNCRAVVMSKDGVFASGMAGPCNV